MFYPQNEPVRTVVFNTAGFLSAYSTYARKSGRTDGTNLSMMSDVLFVISGEKYSVLARLATLSPRDEFTNHAAFAAMTNRLHIFDTTFPPRPKVQDESVRSFFETHGCLLGNSTILNGMLNITRVVRVIDNEPLRLFK